MFLNESITQSGQLSFQRPLLILLDRNFDLATPLHHTWTYQALMHDLLDLKLNRIEIEKASTSSSSKTYDLLSTDKFWKLQKGNTFPVVAESIQEEIDKYKQYENEVKSLKDTITGEGASSEDSMFNNTSKLTTAVSSLPELLEMKRLLDMHTNIATALLDIIKVYNFFLISFR